MSDQEVLKPTTILDIRFLQQDHLWVDPVRERALRVEDEGDPAGHAGSEVPTGRAQDHGSATGHVLAAMIADTFHHCHGTGVSDAEPLPDPPPDEGLARSRPVENYVSGDDLLLSQELGIGWRSDSDTASGEALADVVVRVTGETQGDSSRHERPETVSRRSVEIYLDRVVG